MIHHPIEYLEMLWDKPESTRKIIAGVAVFVLSSMIIGAWLMTFSLKPSLSIANAENQAVAEPQQIESLSPLKTLWSSALNMIRSNPLLNK